MKSILKDKDLDKHQRKALIVSKDHTEYIVEPNTLDPLIAVYEKSNKTFRMENATLRSDTTRLCDALETLIKDNSKLREFISKKNEDMGKTLATLSQEEGEIIAGLKDNINIVEEENKHLLFKVQHLEELMLREKDENLEVARNFELGKQDRKRIKEDLDELQLKDKTNTEKITILKEKLKRIEKIYEKEKDEKERLEKEIRGIKDKEFQNSKLKNKNNLLSDEWMKNFNEISQEAVFLREENEFLNEKLRKHMNSLKNQDANKETKKLMEYQNQDILKESQNKSKKFEDLYRKTLKKLRILQSLDDVPGTGDLPHKEEKRDDQVTRLRIKLKAKNSELEAEKRKNKDYIREIERVNKELVDKITRDNTNLKIEKSGLLAKLNKLLENNVKTSQKLDLAEATLGRKAGVARINSLEEDNERLRKKLSEFRRGSEENSEDILGEKIMQLKKALLKNDQDYKEALKKLHGDLKALEGERINQQHQHERQNTAIKNLYDALEKEKKSRKVLSLYIIKLHKGLVDSGKFNSKDFTVPRFIKDNMNSESLVGSTPRSDTSEVSKFDIQNVISRSHTDEKPLETRKMDKKSEAQQIGIKDQANNLSESGSQKNVRFADDVKPGSGAEVIAQTKTKIRNNNRPNSAPKPQINQGLRITEQGVTVQETPNVKYVYPDQGYHTHDVNFYQSRAGQNHHILPPPRRRRLSHKEMLNRSPELRHPLPPPSRPRFKAPISGRVTPFTEVDPYGDAREIVTNAYGRVMHDPMMDTISSNLTLGDRSLPMVGSYDRPNPRGGLDYPNSISGGINDLIRRYNETDLYNKV